MRKCLIFILLLLIPAVLGAQDRRSGKAQRDSLAFDPLYLDTVTVVVPPVNNYSSIGVQYGVSLSRMNLNTTQKQDWLFAPEYYSVLFTHYEKMFGYLPYFGYQFGIEYGHAGTIMHVNEETGTVPLLDDATRVEMTVADVPFMALVHYDAGIFQASVRAGIYGGYRLSIQREGIMAEEYRNHFKDYEHRFDYGLRGGIGLAVILDPVEFHIDAGVRYSWSEFQEPNYASEYYARFAYPYDVIISAGFTFQLGRRQGKTSAELRREAREIVFGK